MKELEAALYAKLAGDATLSGLAPGGVWRGVAPVGTTGVFVAFAQVSGVDAYTLKDRATTTYNYLIKAIGPGESATPAWNAAARIDALLNDQPLTLSAGSVMSVRRERAMTMTETDGGEQYQHAGGYYIIWTQG
jgi:hypothetical protein